MAHNDMYVVMYKIIAYLYECSKSGERPDSSGWSADALGIPEQYWAQVVREMVSHDLVGGVRVNTAMGGHVIITSSSPYVTMEGVQFATENSMMARAAAFLREAKAAIPFV